MQKLMSRSPDPLDPTTWTEYWYDDETDGLITKYVQDVEEILLDNRREANENKNARYTSEIANKVASIPCTVILKWKYELGIDLFNVDHAERVRKLLNSSEYRYLRTHEGRL